MNIGDVAYMAYASIYSGSVVKSVVRVTVAAVIDGAPLYRTLAGVRHALSVETIHETEAEAWAAVSIRLSTIADEVRAAADEAAAKAARGAVEVTS